MMLYELGGCNSRHPQRAVPRPWTHHGARPRPAHEKTTSGPVEDRENHGSVTAKQRSPRGAFGPTDADPINEPHSTDLARHSRQGLDAVAAAELDSRPRKTLGWDTPAERLAKLLETAGRSLRRGDRRNAPLGGGKCHPQQPDTL